jgi:hypothetical protein
MSRFPDDQDRYDIHLPPDAFDEALEEEDEAEYDDDVRVPVLDDIVLPGPGIAAPAAAGPLDPRQAERLHALIREAVDLALDDALDLLRSELHARLHDHLDERLPLLVAEALRDQERD